MTWSSRFAVPAAALCITAASAANAAEFEAKLASMDAPAHVSALGMVEAAELIKQRTNGEVDITVYPSSQLGGPREMIEGVQLGTIEIATSPTAWLAGFNPLVSVVDIPYILPGDRDQARKLLEGAFGQAVLESFGERGLVALAIWPGGRKLITSNKPLHDIDALGGQRLRIMDSPILVEQMKAVGAIPTVVPFSEVYTALQNGMIDGQENPADAILRMKFFEVQRNALVAEHGAITEMIIANPDWFNGLPPEHQDVIRSTFKEVAWKIEKGRSDEAAEALKFLEEQGMNIRVADEPERAQLRALVYPKARDAYVEAAGSGGQEFIRLYEAELGKLN